MKKVINIDLHPELRRIGDQAILRLRISRLSLTDWLLCLWLLIEELAEIKIHNRNSILHWYSSDNPITEISSGTSEIKVLLSKTNAKALSGFLLRYYRDGRAEVDHIDFEAWIDGEDGYLTFSVDEYIPFITREEAENRLRL